MPIVMGAGAAGISLPWWVIAPSDGTSTLHGQASPPTAAGVTPLSAATQCLFGSALPGKRISAAPDLGQCYNLARTVERLIFAIGV